MNCMRLFAAILLATLLAAPAEAGLLDRLVPVEPLGTVIPAERIEEGRRRRQTIRSQHILDRPNRTIHVYGNWVRSRHAQGRSIIY